MRNRKMPVPGLVLLFASLLLTFAEGCAKKSFAVEVPHGFAGNVHIFCDHTEGFPSRAVQVNALGGGDAESCPGRDANVVVVRDGKTFMAVDVNWERSGDGSPVALSFNVK